MPLSPFSRGPDKPAVFLSSCFADPVPWRLRLRRRLLELTGGPHRQGEPVLRPLWMAEDYPELRPESPWPPFEKAEFCLEGVRNAECFVAVVTARHGSRIVMDGLGAVPSSFFEAELFEAALLGKPAFVFLLKGYEDAIEPQLASLLRLLAPCFPGMELRPLGEDEILRRIERLIQHYRRPRWLRNYWRPPALQRTVDTLLAARHRSYDVRRELPSIRFLGCVTADCSLPPPDLQLVEGVLQRARETVQNQRRLTLVWFALRALMGAPFEAPRHADYLPLWDAAFGAWTSAGAWYGLHGHAHMGCLSALGSLSAVRARTVERSDRGGRTPHGPLASEYYSIGRLAGRRAEMLALSLAHIEAALDSSEGNKINQTAIRASIHREMGHLDAALADYERVAAARAPVGGSSQGEALSELGYALVVAGQKKRGVTLMEQGLELMRADPPSASQVRAMCKLAVGYARCRKLLPALDLAAQAHDLAISIGAHDQIRRLDRLTKRIDTLRGRPENG